MTRSRLAAAAALLAAALLVLRIYGARNGPPDTLAVPAPFASLGAAPSGTGVPSPAVAASVTAAARSGTAVPSPGPAAASPDPTRVALAVLAGLDRARASGYADPAAADPDDWAAPDCPCHAEDARRLRALAALGHHLRGQSTAVRALTVVAATPDRVDATFTDTVAAYEEVDARGRPVARWPAAPPRRWRVTLVTIAGRWRFGAFARAP